MPVDAADGDREEQRERSLKPWSCAQVQTKLWLSCATRARGRTPLLLLSLLLLLPLLQNEVAKAAKLARAP